MNIEDFDSDEMLSVSMEKVLMPFHRQIGEIAVAAVKAEIDDQNLIDTGQFRESIQPFVDLSNFDEMEAGAISKDCRSKEGFNYPLALEFGTTKMAPKAPFQKSIRRVEEALK